MNMAVFDFIEFMILLPLIIVILFVIFVHFRSMKCSDHKLPWNWPILGMSPAVLGNLHRILDKNAEILQSSGGTFLLKGPWFANMDLLLTSDPVNVQHIMNSKFSIYGKGKEWRKRFDIFGNTLFNSDFEEWKYHRGFVRGFLSHQRFHELMPKIYEDSMEKGLMPSIQNVADLKVSADLQSLLKKHLFFISCRMVTGCDPSYFGIGYHEDLFSKAMSDACEAIFDRHILPESIWKMQKWFRIGKEKKLSDAWLMFDKIVAEYVLQKQKVVSKKLSEEEVGFNALDLHLIGHKLVGSSEVPYEVIRDNILGLTFATHDTTSTVLGWFFWLLSKNPIAEKKVRDEVEKFFPDRDTKWVTFGAQELSKMVYLHAALCETLRLYPPVPFMGRSPIQDDILPTGHRIKKGTAVMICTHAMGRMTSVWGEDCHEFKPERWIKEDGEIIHEPPHKFFAFNAGPRICVGKEIAFTVMKSTVSTIIHNYNVEVAEDHLVTSRRSTILHMKNGLMVRLKKRLV